MDNKKMENKNRVPNNIPVTFGSPPSPVDSPQVLFITSVSFILFVIGFCGHVSLLIKIFHVHGERWKKCENRSGKWSVAFHVAILSFADLYVLLLIPSVITNRLLGTWIMGSFVCKLKQAQHSIGRLISPLMLVQMSCHRYYLVTRGEGVRKLWTIVGGLTFVGVATVLLSPTAFFATVQTSPPTTIPVFYPGRRFWNVFVRKRCSLGDMSEQAIINCTIVIFIFGTIIPSISMVVVAVSLCRLRNACRRYQPSDSENPSRLGFSVGANRLSEAEKGTYDIMQEAHQARARQLALYYVIAFYYLSWIPYWLAVVFMHNSEYVESLQSKRLYQYLHTFVHLLPFGYSAFSWPGYTHLVAINIWPSKKPHKVSRVGNGGKLVMGGGREAASQAQSTTNAAITTEMTQLTTFRDRNKTRHRRRNKLWNTTSRQKVRQPSNKGTNNKRGTSVHGNLGRFIGRNNINNNQPDRFSVSNNDTISPISVNK